MQIQFSVYDLEGDSSDEVAQAQAARDSLSSRLPGLRMLLSGSLRSGLDSWGTGRHVPGAAQDPVPGRGELLVFDSDIAATAAFTGPAGRELAAPGRHRPANLRSFSAHGQAVIAFDNCSTGGTCHVSVAGIAFDPDYGTIAQAEHHYVAHHSRLAGRLPGCCGYLIGIVEREVQVPLMPAEPHRLAIAMFDNAQSLRHALASPEGAELNRDAQGLTRVALLYFLDATIRM